MPSIRLLSRPLLVAFLSGGTTPCSARPAAIPAPWHNAARTLHHNNPAPCRWVSSNMGTQAKHNPTPIFCVKPQQSSATDGVDVEGQSEDGDELLDLGEFDDEGSGEQPELSLPPSIQVGKSTWGPAVLKCVQQVLEDTQGMETLELFSFDAKEAARKVEIRLDKTDNEFGSPGLEDIQEFSGALTREMESELGEDEAGMIELEVSSPGAEREVRLPGELDRFKNLPMQVEYVDEKGAMKSAILNLEGLDMVEGVIAKSKWKIADTKAGRFARKGRKLNKKDREQVIELNVDQLTKVNLYLDV